MDNIKKIIITGWSALLKCRVCGNVHESKEYGNWVINSTTIKRCPLCNRTTNHIIVGRVAETMDYEKSITNQQKIQHQ